MVITDDTFGQDLQVGDRVCNRFYRNPELWGTIQELKYFDTNFGEYRARVLWDRPSFEDHVSPPPYFVEIGIVGWTRVCWLSQTSINQLHKDAEVHRKFFDVKPDNDCLGVHLGRH